jgi:excisionase family DNA binding protein
MNDPAKPNASTQPLPSPFRLALGIEEAGSALGLGRTTMFRLIKGGEIKAVKVGGRTIISVSELTAFLERKAT